MAQQQPPRSSFAALAQAMGVDVLRRQEAQIQQDVRETGLPEWQIRQEHFGAREAERQEMMRLTERRIAELRDPRLREAREAREQAEAAEAARAQAADRLRRWADHCRRPHYDAFGHVRDYRSDEPPAWFI